MELTTTLRFDSGSRRERTTSRLEFAAAFALVVALHAALAVWVLRSRERPIAPPEPPRTIVARLLTTAPAAPLAPSPSASPPPAAPTAEPHSAPAHAVEPPRRAQPAHAKPTVAPRPVHREAPAPSIAPAPPSPPESAAPATPPPAEATTPAPPTPAANAPQHSAPAQSSAANAPPKDVSHVDCNIAQPAYPVMSQRHGETGTAVVRFIVGVDGRVESAKIQQSSGYERLDDAALGAVRGGTCRPWKEAGVAVRVAYAQPFVFGLGN